MAHSEVELVQGGGGGAYRWRLRGVAGEEPRCAMIERQSRGSVGFMEEEEFGFLPWSRQLGDKEAMLWHRKPWWGSETTSNGCRFGQRRRSGVVMV
jgi:hypothetical protein